MDAGERHSPRPAQHDAQRRPFGHTRRAPPKPAGGMHRASGGDIRDDEWMFVRTEPLLQASRQPVPVRVHTPIGSAVVLWRGDPGEADGRHLVEWTVDEDIQWGRNTLAASVTWPELRQEGDQVIMSGRLHLTGDGAAHLRMGHWSVLFDLASPISSTRDGSWVQISVEWDGVALYPYRT